MFYALAIDSANAGHPLYRDRWRGMFKSTDGGGNWDPVNTGLNASGCLWLANDPVTPTTLYAGTDYGGIFKSTDGGASLARSTLA